MFRHVKNKFDISTGEIKNGPIIKLPKIGDTQLGDVYKYYLGRQEFFMGERYPIEERITQFVNSVKKVL